MKILKRMFNDLRKLKKDFSNKDIFSPFQLNESWADRRLLAALSQLPTNNLSSSLNMKFQKKQMVEREQKKLALTGGDFSQAANSSFGNGKVRQMFDDRRRGVGIDRSHPLKPIMTPTTATTMTTKTSKRLGVGTNLSTRPVVSSSTTVQNSTITSNSVNNNSFIANANIFASNLDEVDNIDDESFPKEFSLLSLNNTHGKSSVKKNDSDLANNNNEENSNFGGTIIINKRTSPKSNSIKLNPVITKKSPMPTTTAKPASRAASNSSRTSTLSKTTTSSIKSPPSKTALSSAMNKNLKPTGNNTSSIKPATFILSVKPPPRISTPPAGMASCEHCQRHFNEERLSKHEEVCRKMMSKKRKIFDASKHRVKGTEAENYLKKGKTLSSTPSKSTTVATVNAITAVKKAVEKKSNWRKKHEEFIAAIRDAKKVQAYLAKGGKLSDLPPPPPSENPDYIQCPHCTRRFNESAAERHIPRCANMQHNKPKPNRKRF